MKEYTLKEWQELPTKERIKHNTNIMQMADFDITKVEICECDDDTWREKTDLTIYYHNQYRLKPTPEQQFQELIKRKGFEVGKRVKYKDCLEYSILDITDSLIKFFNGNDKVWTYNCNELEDLERLELLPEPTQEEITAKFVKDNNLKVGDKLKVVRKFESKEWDDWTEPMNKFIGKIGEIIGINTLTIRLRNKKGVDWVFPPQSLEVIKYRPFKDSAEFEPYYDKGIHVRRKGFVEKLRVNGFDNEWVQIAHIGYYDYNYCLKHIEIINSITDETGKPFGVEI